MRFILLLILFVFFYLSINAQQPDKELIQFTGRVINEFLQPVPFCHIVNIENSKGTVADKEGKFSFVVHKGDLIRFSSVGYKKSKVEIPDTLKEPFFVRDVLLTSDTILITEIEVYPWADYEEFKDAFINLELPEDDLDRARKNIALIKTQIIINNNPSARENFNQVMQQQFDQTSVRGTHPTYQIFNVFAWQKFFEALQNGDFKNKDNK